MPCFPFGRTGGVCEAGLTCRLKDAICRGCAKVVIASVNLAVGKDANIGMLWIERLNRMNDINIVDFEFKPKTRRDS